jgi:CBS domain-containing protein
MKVRDLMSYPLCIVKPEDSVKDVIDAMTAEKKGIAIIAKDGILSKCEGFVTKGEIFIRVFVKGLDPGNVKIADIMTPGPLVTISPNVSCKEAAKLMIKHNIRRLPVVDNDSFVGIITCENLLKCVE